MMPERRVTQRLNSNLHKSVYVNKMFIRFANSCQQKNAHNCKQSQKKCQNLSKDNNSQIYATFMAEVYGVANLVSEQASGSALSLEMCAAFNKNSCANLTDISLNAVKSSCRAD